MAVDKTLIGPAGEHLVLARLLSQGLLASPAPRGTRKVDIIVNYIDGGNPKLIQVKTTMGSAKQGWFLAEKYEEIYDEDLYYCFVDYGVQNGDVYVIPAAVVAKTIKEDHAHWLATPGKNGQAHSHTSMRRLRASIFGQAENWLENYKENWSLLVSDL